MALSEQERNALEQLEKQFRDDDPEFADAMQAEPVLKHSALRIVLGVLTAVAGISIVLLGASLHEPIAGITVGILGFSAQIAGGYIATMRSVRTGSKLPRRASRDTSIDGETAPEKDRLFKGGLGDAAFWTLFWWV
ncbi:DUF3040 domain-containing protein [Arthrobacter globiformis]|uniref:DUF3040 domain-containing protein n=1 Tax=Arthrobacter globiformis TaxID=1665 RepID=UPI002780E020|nr:DUF3040 domain-containing protein [Arthrobacter globiformis]MDQ0867505.1 hypothetical protein [Arthrobacter globiformis]